MPEKPTSDEDLKTKMWAMKAVSVGKPTLSDANGAVARNVLDGDLGRFSDPLPTYQLDEATRDRLLVHARQDASHALANTISTLSELAAIKSRQTTTNIFLLLLLLCVALIMRKLGVELPIP